jgi:hypothetical protein
VKGINNRQKMIVTPRKSGEKDTLTFVKGKNNELAHVKMFGMKKSEFRKKIL